MTNIHIHINSLGTGHEHPTVAVLERATLAVKLTYLSTLLYVQTGEG